jgi:hypothetical protein
MTYYQVYNKSTTTGATIGAGTANPHDIHVAVSLTHYQKQYIKSLKIAKR